VQLDRSGFVSTAGDGRWALESSVHGVFAIGDVRAGSIKRVGAAIGEGATVVAQIHKYLEDEASAQARSINTLASASGADTNAE
jgi:thioredoxin reductase (NADPH)